MPTSFLFHFHKNYVVVTTYVLLLMYHFGYSRRNNKQQCKFPLIFRQFLVIILIIKLKFSSIDIQVQTSVSINAISLLDSNQPLSPKRKYPSGYLVARNAIVHTHSLRQKQQTNTNRPKETKTYSKSEW